MVEIDQQRASAIYQIKTVQKNAEREVYSFNGLIIIYILCLAI